MDGGRGQLNIAHEVMVELGLEDVPLVGIAKGPDRDAGREQKRFYDAFHDEQKRFHDAAQFTGAVLSAAATR